MDQTQPPGKPMLINKEASRLIWYLCCPFRNLSAVLEFVQQVAPEDHVQTRLGRQNKAGNLSEPEFKVGDFKVPVHRAVGTLDIWA